MKNTILFWSVCYIFTTSFFSIQEIMNFETRFNAIIYFLLEIYAGKQRQDKCRIFKKG